MSAEAPQAKKRKIRCGNCGEEGHNKLSCLRNAQVSSSSQSAKNQSCENRGHAQASRRWRDVGEIDDEKAEEDSQDESGDLDEEDGEDDMDDWTPEELVWDEWQPLGIHLLKAKTGHLCHSSDVKYGVGANVDHPDVNRKGFNHTSTLDILGLFITDAIISMSATIL